MKRSWLRNILSDQEFWLVLVFNIAIFVSFLNGATSASTIVFLYYVQSVLIGIQYIFRLVNLGRINFPQGGLSAKIGTAVFFTIHYGLFHLVYLIFLIAMMKDIPGVVEFDMLKWLVPALAVNTILSTISDIKRDKSEPKAPVGVMFQPYLRVFPMHLLIIFGFNSKSDVEWAFLLFIGLKTLADVLMHIVVNKTYRDQRPNVTGGWI